MTAASAKMNLDRITGAGSILLGVGIAVSAVLGPLGFEVIWFRTSEHLTNQFVGGEIVSLAVVAPMAAAAGVLWLHGHRLAPAIAMAPTLYAVYTYLSVVLGQEYARYDGNVERYFPLYAGLVAGGLAVAAAAWSRLGRVGLPVLPDRLRRALAGVLLATGGLITLAWAQQIRSVVTGDLSADYLESPTLFWVIKILDFGFVIPLAIATGAGLLRQQPAAIKAAYGLIGFLTCLAGSVTGMAVAMEIKDDPSSQPVVLAVLLPVTAGLAALWVGLLRSRLQGSDASLDRGLAETRARLVGAA